MTEKHNLAEFKKAMKQGDWRTRYESVLLENFTGKELEKEQGAIEILLYHRFDPSIIVRQEIVKTCNLLHIKDVGKNKGKEVVLFKMQSLDRTLSRLKINPKKIVLDVFGIADIPFYPRNRKITESEWITINNIFKNKYPKEFDVIDGRTVSPDTYGNNKAKDKVHKTINTTRNRTMEQKIYNWFNTIPNEEIEKYLKTHSDKNIIVPITT